jgi:AraC-like DNA-binding protein
MTAPQPPLDRLDALLKRFSVSAKLFHAGPLCGGHDFQYDEGFLHVVRSGTVEVHHERLKSLRVDEPSLLFYPRPLGHRFVTDKTVGADMACATVRFSGGASNPMGQALPPLVAMPLSALEGMESLLDLLFAEALSPRCGRQAVVDRLFEVLIIQLIRKLMNDGDVHTGLLAGLAHPQLAKALVALHEAPAGEWTLEELAARAGMSRSVFANAFRDTVGVTPGDYLAAWRVTLAQDLLKRGRALKHVALDVGYGSTVALSRAFKARTGVSPREWKGLA